MVSAQTYTPECTAVSAPGPGNVPICQVTVQCPPNREPIAVLRQPQNTCDCQCKLKTGANPGTPSPSANPSGPPGGGGPGGGGNSQIGPCTITADEWFGDGDCSLKTWAGVAIKYMIGFGIAYAVIVTPYIFYLFGTGDPGKKKQGRDLLNSVVFGLILLVFCVTVVSLIGINILQI